MTGKDLLNHVVPHLKQFVKEQASARKKNKKQQGQVQNYNQPTPMTPQELGKRVLPAVKHFVKELQNPGLAQQSPQQQYGGASPDNQLQIQRPQGQEIRDALQAHNNGNIFKDSHVH
jgi:hypothetical protein